MLDLETYRDICLENGFEQVDLVEPHDLEDEGLVEFFENKVEDYWLETEIWVART